MTMPTGCIKRVISCTTIYSFSNCWNYIYVVKNFMYCSSKMHTKFTRGHCYKYTIGGYIHNIPITACCV